MTLYHLKSYLGSDRFDPYFKMVAQKTQFISLIESFWKLPSILNGDFNKQKKKSSTGVLNLFLKVVNWQALAPPPPKSVFQHNWGTNRSIHEKFSTRITTPVS